MDALAGPVRPPGCRPAVMLTLPYILATNTGAIVYPVSLVSRLPGCGIIHLHTSLCAMAMDRLRERVLPEKERAACVRWLCLALRCS